MAEDKRAETYVELARLKAESFYDRRRYDWKITLGFWAVLIGIVYHEKTINGWWLIAAVAAYAYPWLWGAYVANENDKDLSDHFMFAAEKILLNKDATLEEHKGKLKWCCALARLKKKPSPLFQFVATVFLAVVAYELTHGK